MFPILQDGLGGQRRRSRGRLPVSLDVPPQPFGITPQDLGTGLVVKGRLGRTSRPLALFSTAVHPTYRRRRSGRQATTRLGVGRAPRAAAWLVPIERFAIGLGPVWSGGKRAWWQ